MEQTQVISRLGCFTSSEIGKLLKGGRTKGQLFGDTAMTYINEKIAEVVTGERKQQPNSASLEWGVAQEIDALMTFKSVMGFNDDEITFYGGANFKYFEYNEFSGGSPDGGTNDACIEAKSPYVSSNHIEVLLLARESTGKFDFSDNVKLKHYNDLYYAQLQWNMFCMGKDKGYFISYDPRTVDYSNRIAILRIKKDDEYISMLKDRLNAAVEIVRTSLQLINQVNSK